jgi:hypothetical protein
MRCHKSSRISALSRSSCATVLPSADVLFPHCCRLYPLLHQSGNTLAYRTGHTRAHSTCQNTCIRPRYRRYANVSSADVLGEMLKYLYRDASQSPLLIANISCVKEAYTGIKAPKRSLYARFRSPSLPTEQFLAAR